MAIDDTHDWVLVYEVQARYGAADQWVTVGVSLRKRNAEAMAADSYRGNLDRWGRSAYDARVVPIPRRAGHARTGPARAVRLADR
ncbi:MAG: hypothetical protein ACXVW5_24285 [Solirubrobacteraceae bacterium]